MPDELRAQSRALSLSREEWITKFVNAIVREFRPDLPRMTAVAAARETWVGKQDISPYLAAKAWADAGPEATAAG